MESETKKGIVQGILLGLLVALILGIIIVNGINYRYMSGCKFEGVNNTIIIKANRKCFYNQCEINCNNSLELKTLTTSGNFDCKPIMKYDKDWENQCKIYE